MDLLCDNCWYHTYDADQDAFFCDMLIDEDEWYRIWNDPEMRCPYFRPDDDYDLPRKQ